MFVSSADALVIYSVDGLVLPFSRPHEGVGAARLESSRDVISSIQHQRPCDLGDAVGMCSAIRTRQVGPHSCIGPIIAPGNTTSRQYGTPHPMWSVSAVPSVCPQYSAHPLAQADTVRRAPATFACGQVPRRRRPNCMAETGGAAISGTGRAFHRPDWHSTTDRGRCAHSAPHGPAVRSGRVTAPSAS